MSVKIRPEAKASQLPRPPPSPLTGQAAHRGDFLSPLASPPSTEWSRLIQPPARSVPQHLSKVVSSSLQDNGLPQTCLPRLFGDAARRCDLRRPVDAPAVLPDRFRIQLGASAVVLLLGHMSVPRWTLNWSECQRDNTSAATGPPVIKASAPLYLPVKVSLSSRSEPPKLQLSVLPRRPRRHGDINTRSRPASAPPRPAPGAPRRGAAGSLHPRAVSTGWTGWIHRGGGLKVRREDRDQSTEETEGVIDEDRDERAEETGGQRVKHPDSLTAKRIRL